MNTSYTFIPDLVQSQTMPADGILTRTIHADDDVKVVLFTFSPGQELSEHTASMPAILHFIQGEATLTLGSDTMEVRPGSWVHMPAMTKHSIRTKTPVVMLLSLIKV
ncbi:MAG TPA: cupin domain-containing protein [Phycisphaerae bacterium]|nr:cupin domain-containing protein [Phycisphaerae bacterium]